MSEARVGVVQKKFRRSDLGRSKYGHRVDGLCACDDAITYHPAPKYCREGVIHLPYYPILSYKYSLLAHTKQSSLH
jgi:hypothetical protein